MKGEGRRGGEAEEPPAESALEEELSRPGAAVVEAMGSLGGDLLVLGAGGKMGPSLARLAARALAEAGARYRVTAVSRFGDAGLRASLEQDGVTTLAADLLAPGAVAALPDAPNVVFMVGQKFGTSGDEARTWAVNTWLPGVVAERYAGSRIVAFSTGNVYPLSPADGPGPSESDPLGPIGSYAWSALARERVFEFFSRRDGTPVALLRLNYAVEPRYGVLRDIADRLRRDQAVDLTMGSVNLIWQADANALALRALAHTASPPLVLNVTGPKVAVRQLAEELGRRLGVTPRFEGSEAPTALLSNPARMVERFGAPETLLESMLDRVATWIREGGRSLGKPTHFEEREGRF